MNTEEAKILEAARKNYDELWAENERLKTIVEKLGEVIGGFIDDSFFLSYVKPGLDCEPFLKSDVDEFEKRFGGIDHVTLDDSHWCVTYTLDGIENYVYFENEVYDIDNLPEAIAELIVAHLVCLSTASKNDQDDVDCEFMKKLRIACQ